MVKMNEMIMKKNMNMKMMRTKRKMKTMKRSMKGGGMNVRLRRTI